MNQEGPPRDALAYSVADGARIIGIGERTLWRMVREHGIPYSRIEDETVIKRDTLHRYADVARQWDDREPLGPIEPEPLPPPTRTGHEIIAEILATWAAPRPAALPPSPLVNRRSIKGHERAFIVEQYCQTCAYCLRVSASSVLDPDGHTWHIDHIHPLARGGTYALANLALSCAHCNHVKNVTLGKEVIPPEGMTMKALRQRRAMHTRRVP